VLTPDPEPDCPPLRQRTSREALADEAYCRLRQLLQLEPEVFLAVREGLTIAVDDLDVRVMRAGGDDALVRSKVSSAALADGWLLRATYRYWLLLPDAFECGEELPSGVQDLRYESIATCWSRDGRRTADDAVVSQLDVW
jgi:hypothetical protein